MARIPFGQPGPVSACVLLFALSSIVAATTNIPATMTSARALPPGLSMQQTRKIQLFGTYMPAGVLATAMPPVHRDNPNIVSQRNGDGTNPVPHAAVTSPETLSDTKIFILLAAIVFLFLLALGIAMARVSTSRRRQQEEHIAQEIMTAVRPPETLNKSILDILPVFEVTEKLTLRRIYMRSPRFAFDECFDDECSDEYSDNDSSSSSRDMSVSMVSLAPRKPQAQISSYMRADMSPELSDTQAAQDMPPEHVYPEMHGWSPTPVFEHPQVDKFASRSFPGSPRLSLHSSLNSDVPLAEYARCLNRARVWPIEPAGDHWDDQTPVRDIESECVPGVIRYRDQRSRSLDLTPEPTPGFDSSDHSVPIALRTAVSQIECSSRSVCGSDDGLGACPICLEEFEVGDHVRELPCKHKYHLICIDTWLVSRSTSCPYCKMDIRRWYYGPDVPDAIPRSGPLSNAQHMPIGYNGGPIESAISIPDDATMAGRSRWGRVRAAMRRAFEPDPMMT